MLKTAVPGVVATLRQMRKNVAPSTIPTMAAMLTAAAMDLSPNAWRLQFGDCGPSN